MFEVIKRNGRYWLRFWDPIFNWKGGYDDSMIYGIKTGAPYYKWMGMKYELDEELQAKLAEAIMAA